MNQTAFVRACLIAGLLLLVGCADASDIAWQERIEIDSGQAFQGPWRMNESQFLYVDDPSVAFCPHGGTGVVWVDNAQRDVLFQVLEADGSPRFPEAVNVSRTPNVFSWLPRFVFGEDEAVFVLWHPLGTGFVLSSDGGERFSEPAIIPGSNDPELGFNGSLQGLLMAPLAMDESGRVAVVNSTFLPGEHSAIWLQKGLIEP